jgi:hypothetical protein
MIRPLLTSLIIAVACGVIAFHNFAGLRESVRGFQVSEKKEEQYDAYRQGKALLLSQWQGPIKPSLAAWGDDRWEGAESIDGEKWLVHGRFTAGSAIRTPWCILFVIDSGRTFVRETGPNAIRVMQLVDSGQYRSAMAQFPVNLGNAVSATQESHGTPRWEYHSPLDSNHSGS